VAANSCARPEDGHAPRAAISAALIHQEAPTAFLHNFFTGNQDGANDGRAVPLEFCDDFGFSQTLQSRQSGAARPVVRLQRGAAFDTSNSMNTPESGKLQIHSEEFLHTLMRRQLRLSIGCAGAFLVALLGLPLANYFFPEIMAARVFGFTLAWLILGVLFFPLVWIIAWIFIKRSIALEEAEVREAGGKRVGEPVSR
jgi:uncharacterized membrane protein (DUF485 family)